MKKTLRRMLSIMIAACVIFATLSVGFAASAAEPKTYEKVSDPETMQGWKSFFYNSEIGTEDAGGVWMDKSVFADASSFTGLTDAYDRPITPTVSDDSFLVALSAIASNKSIVGYSNIPTDTVLVLDVSGSMGPRRSGEWGTAVRNDAVKDLVLAANAAITRLLALNEHNRVGIVLYSESSSTLLEIDRYTAANKITYDNGTPQTNDDVVVSEYLVTNANNSHNGTIVKIAPNVKDGKKNAVYEESVNVTGGTFIQNGLARAEELFEERSDANDTTIDEDDFQAGAERKPVIVLMSDGAPTYGTTNYTNPTSNSLGNGSSSSAMLAFLTQLTAAYVREKATEYYNGSEALFYSLGLSVGSNSNAQSVLNPSGSTATDSYWADYLAASNNSTVTLGSGNSRFSVTRNSIIESEAYVNGYFSADTGSQLFEAFDKIVNEIIIQSLYRPTLVVENNAHMEGYIEFIDDIGDYMKVEEIEGIKIGNKLYTGEKLQEAFTQGGSSILGTVENPTAMGDTFIWAVKERLGIEDTETARALVRSAFADGQLSTTSNYIGWYGDKDNNFIKYWNDKDTYAKMPTEAVYCNKSYGMLGEIKDGLNESDLMYVSIQVHTKIVPMADESLINNVIEAGHCQMVYRIPASLIPIVSYSIELEGTSYENARNIEMTVNSAEPITLLFEVGLRNDLDKYNIAEKLGTAHSNNGKYVFYTNEYSQSQYEKSIDLTDSQHIFPKDAINTVAYFEPNLDNEKYYYTEPTAVYYKDGSNYARYSSQTKPAAGDGREYYHKRYIFKYTDDANDGNAAYIVNDGSEFQRITDAAIAEAQKSETNGGWVIPKGTVKHVWDDYTNFKSENKTGTLAVAHNPLVVEHTEGSGEETEYYYYADAILGNNGRLTVTPATGIKLSKTVDNSLIGTDETFEFEITVEDASGDYELAIDRADGSRDISAITFTAGKATLGLKANETAYVVGLEKGKDYSVSEKTAGKDYKVKASSGTAGIIEEYKLADVKFENQLINNGYVIVSKEVRHPYAEDPAALESKAFKFEATLSGTTAPTIEAHFSGEAAPRSLNVVGSKVSFELKNDQSVVLVIEHGAVVNIAEVDNSHGFALNGADSTIPQNATVGTENIIYHFINDYRADEVSVPIDIGATKRFTGRPWDADEFKFILSRFDEKSAEYVEIKSETVSTSSNGTAAFGDELSDAISRLSFREVGSYRFELKEYVPAQTFGITYDQFGRYFDIVVTDNDMDGKLEARVTAVDRVTVRENAGEYYIEANFTNVYAASGIAEIKLEVKKEVETTSGEEFSPKGFEFAVYDSRGNMVGEVVKTDANGMAAFSFTYTAENVFFGNDQIFDYLLKEHNTGIGGMTYANDVPFRITVKDMLDGTIKATADVAEQSAEGNPMITVVNRYDPADVAVEIIGSKAYIDYEGEALELEGEDFEFSLTPVGNAPNAPNAKNDADGNFKFSLSFDKVGVYEYKLKEVVGTDEDISYDDSEYDVKITVTDDKAGQLNYEVVILKSGESVQEISFVNENTFDPDSGDLDDDELDNDLDEDLEEDLDDEEEIEDEIEEEKEEPRDKAPQTGETTNLSLIFAILFFGGLGVLFSFRRKTN